MTARRRRQIAARAAGRCEYCGIPDRYHALPFQVDHIVAKIHGGRSVLANLAYTCAVCNAHKGTNLSGIDPRSRRVVRLFNPRKQYGVEHFHLVGARIVGRTSVGRATAAVLAMNLEINVQTRQVLIDRGLY